MSLDSPGSLIAELERCNEEIGEFAHAWSQAAGELKAAEKTQERLYLSALRGTQGPNAEARKATAYAAVEEVKPGLAEEIERLVGVVEAAKTRFKTIDRRSNNVQTLLSLHRESARIESFTPRSEMAPPGGPRTPGEQEI